MRTLHNAPKPSFRPLAYIALAVGLAASIALHAYLDFSRDCQKVRDGMVRLHVLANSDSQEDQAVKLSVRDALLAHSDQLFGSASTREEAESSIARQLGDIEAIARAELQRQGRDEPVRAQLVNMFFTTRQYEDVTVPAGRYDAVRVTIGQGKGKNWWCVMFPPMCVPAAMEESLPIEEQVEKLGATPTFTPKFAVVELVETIKEKISGQGDEVLAESEPPAEPFQP